jgi:hypothetical protein
MRVSILNGNPSVNDLGFDVYLNDLSSLLETEGHTVTNFKLREMNIKFCIGCFDCLVKTPGECIVTDDARWISQEYINSDFVLYSSPINMGFTSALLRKISEKFLPFILPAIELVRGEVHHVLRYAKYPVLGLLLEKSGIVDDEDIDIISDIYKRQAVTFNTSLRFVKLTSDPVKEVANAINNL